MACCSSCETGRACAGKASHGITDPGCPPGHHLVRVEGVGLICTPSGEVMLDPSVATCRPLPWQPGKINSVVDEHMNRGQTDPGSLVATVLERVYGRTWDDTAIPWQNLPADASQCLHELERAVKAFVDLRVSQWHATAAQKRYGAVLAQGQKGRG